MVCQFESRRIELRDNLLAVYSTASPQARLDGLSWYSTARQTVREWSKRDGLSISTIACIIAALSPQLDWQRNLLCARQLLDGEYPRGPFTSCIRKANEILIIGRERGKRYIAFNDMLRLFPQGPKVNCFAHNLAGIDTVVTVDGHAIRAALNDIYSTLTVKWTPYRIFAECYAQAAYDAGMPAATFQAIVWCAWKEKYPTNVKKGLRRQW